MRNYELAYIADPDLDEESLSGLQEKVTGWVNTLGGQVLGVDNWQKRRLAYPINKQDEGYYVFMQVQLPPDAGQALERDLRINEQILRFMITAKEAE